ncbi:MAG: methylenetetrahydrofolate--tRNA-(uracil(54)-C(5))-methyltransferase (FADH(2)-oxidizing) TrmFO [Anaerolineae bacterium]|jgi:methylenetetrahydrofolate--tRNA-(uracil-5-)-methyltransferase|nr:methylenetetrahydrofolate--tRNA-(uracil(54)-C(5))-methyltransferase (FADH(2)-oxidizing) TrmFO [Anaerolineae bacterium]MDH7474065.1 methylenetetrahydrofolate--tRNA-(uracil(54)-C(5))-methyltransferase (FADH(2)-oxidizing) TrmFO [Anaerolineae bacterium]
MQLTVIGGGLAGSEAAWQAAQRGVDVILYEMRPQVMTPAHVSGDLGELVCSNSLGSNLEDRAPGLLKAELRRLNSLILACADETAVPAGGALAVGREAFARLVTERVSEHPRITVVREEVRAIPDGVVVIATGPLTSDALADEIAILAGREHLYFYDAMAPIVTYESIDQNKAFRASRYGRGEDYLNCPMTEAEYDAFVEALLAAETIPLRQFEREDKRFFEACLPVEVIARRGRMALAYGPLKPVGLTDPHTGRRPFAVVQLRQDNLAATLYNLVGFQTNLKWGEQERVFRMIPGLEHAEFVRFGQMHRNTFIHSPELLNPTMEFRTRPGLFFGGQITGTEGYVSSAASGLVAGLNAARLLQGLPLLTFPPTTMIGALCHYVTTASGDFQPMKPNFGLLPPLEPESRRKRDRQRAYAERALRDLGAFIAANLT